MATKKGVKYNVFDVIPEQNKDVGIVIQNNRVIRIKADKPKKRK